MKNVSFKTAIIIIIVELILNASCTQHTSEKSIDELFLEGDEISDLIHPNLRNTSWWFFALQDTSYSRDWILYEGLGIEGKSYSEVEQLYGKPDETKKYKLRYGCYKPDFPDIAPVYLKLHDRPYTAILHCIWNNVDTFRTREVYFERKCFEYETLWGYQYNPAQVVVDNKIDTSK